MFRSFTTPERLGPIPAKAIIFDLLTGLLDSWTLWSESTPDQSMQSGQAWRTRYLELTFSCGPYRPYEDLVRQAARDVSLPETTSEDLFKNWSRLKAWPEVAEVVQCLREQGYLLGIVTNCSIAKGREAVQCVETAPGIPVGFRFDAVVTAEESGFYKPSKEAYHAILKALGVDRDQVVFVAGSAGDVQGASEAGFRVVWNNHAGLPLKASRTPMREARNLRDALHDLL